MKKLYGIGVGPGDSELITVKGKKAVDNATHIFIPESGGKSFAGEIASKYIGNKNIVKLDIVMGEDNNKRYERISKIISETILDGETGVFLTIGDPMTYSTYIYIIDNLMNTDIKVETVPGISSFIASLSKLNIPFSIKGESAHIVDGYLREGVLKYVDTVCILKVNKKKMEIIDMLERNNFKYYYAERVGTEQERFFYDKDEIKNRDDYMSLIIGKRIKT